MYPPRDPNNPFSSGPLPYDSIHERLNQLGSRPPAPPPPPVLPPDQWDETKDAVASWFRPSTAMQQTAEQLRTRNIPTTGDPAVDLITAPARLTNESLIGTLTDDSPVGQALNVGPEHLAVPAFAAAAALTKTAPTGLRFARRQAKNEAARLARATAQGFGPELYYHQAFADDARKLIREGFDLSILGSGRKDIYSPTAAFTKSHANQIPLAPAHVPMEQIPLRTRAQTFKDFADRPALETYLRAQPGWNNEFNIYEQWAGAEFPQVQQRFNFLQSVTQDPAFTPAEQQMASQMMDVLNYNWERAKDAKLQGVRNWIASHFKGQGYDAVRLALDQGGADVGHATTDTVMFLRPEQLRHPDAAFNRTRMHQRGLMLSLLTGLGLSPLMLGGQDDDVAAPPPTLGPPMGGR